MRECHAILILLDGWGSRVYSGRVSIDNDGSTGVRNTPVTKVEISLPIERG